MGKSCVVPQEGGGSPESVKQVLSLYNNTKANELFVQTRVFETEIGGSAHK